MVIHSDKYRIHRNDDYDLTPEETFVDTLSNHAVVEIPISRNAFRVFIGFVLVIIAVFFFQAFRLQGIRGATLATIADQSNYNRYPIPATRGIIYDRNGVPLVENVAAFDLVAIRSEIMSPKYASSIDTIKNLVAFSEPVETLLQKNKDNGVFVLKKNMPKDEAIRVQAAHVPGVYVVPYAHRNYPYAKVFSHVLGYTSQITPDELRQNPHYQFHERIGRVGLEAFYETKIKGESTSVALRPEGIEYSPSRQGENLHVTLDVNVQKRLYQAVDETFRAQGVTRGAAIVQHVKTGEVLGMVSMPAFDPNVFEKPLDTTTNDALKSLFSNSNKPLFNRSVGGLYAPGSTIKPLYALAGLKEKIVTPQTTVMADGGITVQSEVDPAVTYTYRDWKVHGLTDLRKAIAWSVDVYFYALGGGYGDIRGLGIDRLEKYLRMFRADKKTGIDIPGEAQGFVPSKAWKKEKKGESWYVGDSYNVSIGQGDLLVTPIWLSMYVSAVANGGSIIKPHVVQSGPEVLGTLPFDSATMKIVQEGMRQTILDGTASSLQSLPVAVAAKTGTAQVGGQALNSLFIVYGPFENPEIAVTVLIEHIPQSQSLAVKVARDFLSWYFGERQAIN